MTESNLSTRTFYLVGNPNSGKTTIFNKITGVKQKTGNYPGITTEKKSAKIKFKKGDVEIVDLPGLYSLNARTEDEKVSARILKDIDLTSHSSGIVYVADAPDLKRCLLLFSELPHSYPKVLVINKIDLLQNGKDKIDSIELSKKLNCQIIEVDAKKGKGLKQIEDWINLTLSQTPEPTHEFKSQGVIKRFIEIDGLLTNVISQNPKSSEFKKRGALDKILLHKFWGFLIFFSLLFLIFQTLFAIAEYPMNWIEALFGYMQSLFTNNLSKGVARDLLVEGIIPGLSGVLVFIPQIAILFFFIGILEQTGYMARAAHLMDGIMRKFGMNGKSVLPLVSGFACAVPAIMATRTIEGWKQRLITMFVLPLTTCSARLPVYVLLIEAFIPDNKLLGVFGFKGLTMFGLYVIGIVSAMVAGWIMAKLVKFKSTDLFIFELPKLQYPSINDITINIFSRVKIFVWEAGRIIFVLSILLWFLASYGPGDTMKNIDFKYDNAIKKDIQNEKNLNSFRISEKLEKSYLGIAGNAIEPAIRPLGFDWKIGISLIASFAAREVMVGTLATIYGVGNEDGKGIVERIKNDKNPDGSLKFTMINGLSLLLFYAFALQCMSTLAIMKRETDSWKWPILQFVLMTGLAYFSSLLLYQTFS